MPEPSYRVFIRVPISRGDFVDPPPVNWDSSKDEALWRILSKVSKTQIEWAELAERFGVTVDFLIRQVAYLTEQHASQVRDELRKAAAAAKGSAAPSPVPGSEPAMGHQRVPSSLSIRKDFMFQRNEASGTGTPIEPSLRPDISRNTSGNSPAYSHNLGGGSTPRPATREGPRPGETLTQRRRMPSFPVLSPNPPSPGPADSSSDDSDDSSPAQSRIIRRPPRFQPQDEPRGYGYDDDDIEPAFQAQNHESSDLNSTLRGDGTAISGDSGKNKGRLHQSQTSDSSTGSTAVIPRPQKSAGRGQPGPISPRAAQLAGRSPGGKSKVASRVGSDGTRSMGSSFSDLEDSSVTDSAMVEALADGAMGSRLSLAQSLSRRFAPRKGN